VVVHAIRMKAARKILTNEITSPGLRYEGQTNNVVIGLTWDQSTAFLCC
jgi:hypothetical protein